MRMLTSLIACLWIAAVAQAAEGRVRVNLEDPQGFKDFSIAGDSADETRDVFARAVESRFVPAAEALLPEEQSLSLTIVDIDMAGEIEPWRNPMNDPVRYVELRYPARIVFDYVIADADGRPVSAGRQDIISTAFQSVSMVPKSGSEPFAHELELLRSWLVQAVAESR